MMMENLNDRQPGLIDANGEILEGLQIVTDPDSLRALCLRLKETGQRLEVGMYRGRGLDLGEYRGVSMGTLCVEGESLKFLSGNNSVAFGFEHLVGDRMYCLFLGNEVIAGMGLIAGDEAGRNINRQAAVQSLIGLGMGEVDNERTRVWESVVDKWQPLDVSLKAVLKSTKVREYEWWKSDKKLRIDIPLADFRPKGKVFVGGKVDLKDDDAVDSVLDVLREEYPGVSDKLLVLDFCDSLVMSVDEFDGVNGRKVVGVVLEGRNKD